MFRKQHRENAKIGFYIKGYFGYQQEKNGEYI